MHLVALATLVVGLGLTSLDFDCAAVVLAALVYQNVSHDENR